jgi:hypothetical protein
VGAADLEGSRAVEVAVEAVVVLEDQEEEVVSAVAAVVRRVAEVASAAPGVSPGEAGAVAEAGVVIEWGEAVGPLHFMLC